MSLLSYVETFFQTGTDPLAPSQAEGKMSHEKCSLLHGIEVGNFSSGKVVWLIFLEIPVRIASFQFLKFLLKFQLNILISLPALAVHTT